MPTRCTNLNRVTNRDSAMVTWGSGTHFKNTRGGRCVASQAGHNVPSSFARHCDPEHEFRKSTPPSWIFACVECVLWGMSLLLFAVVDVFSSMLFYPTILGAVVVVAVGSWYHAKEGERTNHSSPKSETLQKVEGSRTQHTPVIMMVINKLL